MYEGDFWNLVSPHYWLVIGPRAIHHFLVSIKFSLILCEQTVKREEWVMSFEFMGILYQGEQMGLGKDFMENAMYGWCLKFD